MATESRRKKFLEDALKLAEQRKKNQLQALWFQEPSWEPDGGPYPWQAEFCSMTAHHRQLALLAGNQIGKTMTIAGLVSMFATGLYAPWYTGKRFDKPVQILVAGQSNEDVRNVQQKALFGRIHDREPDGTGWVPHAMIGDYDFRQCGVKNVLDYVYVKHEPSGDWSVINLKSYEQGSGKFQGVQFDIAWPDEEPLTETENELIFEELHRRLMARKGYLVFTRTPKGGLTPMVTHFWEGRGNSFVMTKGWSDAPHYSPDQIEEELSNTPPHLRDAVSKGIPALGSGLIFPVEDDRILCDPFPIPDHFARIMGLDFGIDHPAGIAPLAYDRDSDVLYLYDEWREKDGTTADHAAAIQARAKGWIPVAWPHDGDTREKGSGVQLIETYRDMVPSMLPIHAQWPKVPEGAMAINAVEPGIQDMLRRMQDGRLKVFRTCTKFMEEKRMYHRKVEGGTSKIVKNRDDLIDSARTALMMLRFAATKVEVKSAPTQAIDDYDPLANWIGSR